MSTLTGTTSGNMIMFHAIFEVSPRITNRPLPTLAKSLNTAGYTRSLRIHARHTNSLNIISLATPASSINFPHQAHPSHPLKHSSEFSLPHRQLSPQHL